MTEKTVIWLLVLAMPIIFVVILGFSFLIGRFFYISIPALLIWDYIDTKKNGKNEGF